MPKLLRQMAAASIRLVTPLLIPFERRAASRALERSERRLNPVFIIGVPRSGSTLLYKVFANTFHFAFFDNLSSRFFRTPYLGMLLSRLVGARASGELESRYGTFSGMGDPHEFGSFWYRWFRSGLDVYTAPGELPPKAIDEIRKEVFAVSELCGRPIAFKNLFNSMRIGALAECFPGATFVVCRRDPLQNALSLLKGRIENNADKSRWWTVPPKEVGRLLHRPFAEQVAGQVHYISRQIESDIQAIGDTQFLIVDYQDFCEDVHGTLRRAAEFFERRGYALPLDLSDVPASFECRRVQGLDRSDEVAVEQALALIQAE